MTRRSRGFTLVEVVVAFVMLSLVLAAAFEIFSRGLARAGELDDHSKALVIAQSRLATVGIEQTLAEGHTEGVTEDGRFQWTVDIRATTEGVPEGQPPPTIYSLYRVDVRVSWQGADTRTRSVDLVTMQLWPRAT